MDTYNEYKQVYPRDERPRVNLASTYLNLGQFDKALQNALEANQLSPEKFNGYFVAAFAYVAMNRLDDAKAVLAEAQQRKLGAAIIHNWARSLWIRATRRHWRRGRWRTRSSTRLLQRDAGLAAAHGQMRRSRDLFKQAEAVAQRLELTVLLVNSITYEAWIEALIENRADAIKGADAALKQSQTPSVMLAVADVYARAGEDAKALQLADQVVKQRPDDVFVQSVNAPVVRAVVELNHHAADKALDVMKRKPLRPSIVGILSRCTRVRVRC